MHALAVLDYLPKLRRVMGLVVSVDFLHTFFHINVSYLYQMTKFYYFGSVALRVKVLQIESECFRFKPHQVLSCYLAVPQPPLSHYQQDIPTTSMLITELSKILT